jgi:hypothetical protein
VSVVGRVIAVLCQGAFLASDPSSQRALSPTRDYFGEHSTKLLKVGPEARRGHPANPTLRTLVAMAHVLAVFVDELIPDDPPDLRAC